MQQLFALCFENVTEKFFLMILRGKIYFSKIKNFASKFLSCWGKKLSTPKHLKAK